MTDSSGELRFVNRVSWAWWRFREMLDPATGSEVCLVPDDGLIEDLASVRYKITSSGKIQREPKDMIRKRLGRSPDKGDAAVMGLVAASMPGAEDWVADALSIIPRVR